jgi:hypothetical protein
VVAVTHPALAGGTMNTPDGQARARLVEIALGCADTWPERSAGSQEAYRQAARIRAGMKRHINGSWCAAWLTAAMEDAGLVVPPPGTPARREAIALLDFVAGAGDQHRHKVLEWAQPGDVIVWLQHPPPVAEVWRYQHGWSHLFLHDKDVSVCGKATRALAAGPMGEHCAPCAWYTHQGHVAVIVAVDDESITTVGGNEGPKPGRVMKRRLWRDFARPCPRCRGWRNGHAQCPMCRGGMIVALTATVLWRRPGGLYGVARPVAR